jgi:hypothetical protein
MRTWFEPSWCPFGHRVGGWVIHFPAMVGTKSPSTATILGSVQMASGAKTSAVLLSGSTSRIGTSAHLKPGLAGGWLVRELVVAAQGGLCDPRDAVSWLGHLRRHGLRLVLLLAAIAMCATRREEGSGGRRPGHFSARRRPRQTDCRRPVEAYAVGVERRPVHDGIAGSAMPAGVSAAAAAEADDMSDEYLIRTEDVAVRATGGRLRDPLAVRRSD